MDAQSSATSGTIECPLCAAVLKVRACAWVFSEDANSAAQHTLWRHVLDHHMPTGRTEYVSACFCGFKVSSVVADCRDYSPTPLAMLIRYHFATLTPDERREHFLLHQLGAEIQEFDE